MVYRTRNNILYPAVVMEEPLLSSQNEEQEQPNEDNISAERNSARFHGVVIGFLTQVINISGTAVMCYKWGLDTNVLSEHESLWDHGIHWVVWFLSQIDLQLYLVMWLGLTAALTDRGSKFIRSHVGNYSSRSIFVMGVTFYAGVVIGSFISWILHDYFLGLPAPVLPMIGVLIFGLLVSYSMIWCFDMEDCDGDEEQEYTRLTDGQAI
jgi:hypothetical protein